MRTGSFSVLSWQRRIMLPGCNVDAPAGRGGPGSAGGAHSARPL